jgi:hydrogenase small subunit
MISRAVGRIIRPLRLYTNEHLNREVRWDLHGEIPSGWAREKPEPGVLKETGHKFYDVFRRSTDRGKSKVPAWGKRVEWTEKQDPSLERRLPGGAEADGGGAASPEAPALTLGEEHEDQREKGS